MKKHPKNDLIIQLVKDILYNSLAQAIIKILQTPHASLKLVLFVCVALSSSLASYLIIKSVLSYFAYDVNTMTRIIFETPSPFPKITICNSNPFTTEFALEFLKEINREISPSISIFDQNQLKALHYNVKASLTNQIYTRAEYKMNAETFSDSNRTKLSLPLDDLLIACSFNNKPCTKKDFTWEFDPRLGNCYAFNSQSAKNGTSSQTFQSSLAGYDNGLKLTLYANFHENLTFINSVMGNSGVKIRIENNTFIRGYVDSPIQISSGFKTDVLVERLFNFNLPKPYSNCDIDNDNPTHFDSDLYALIKNSSYVYDQQLCLKQCRQKFYVDNCNCSSARTLSLFNVPKCLSNEQMKCKDTFNDIFFSTTDTSAMDKCYGKCPLECYQTDFRVFTSSSQLIGESFVDYIKDNANLANDYVSKEINAVSARESIVRLYVFYDSLLYTLSKETPKVDLVLLVAYIGGILGLFLGVSVLSICEIVELLIEIYFINLELIKTEV